jgi:hypothetical protein
MKQMEAKRNDKHGARVQCKQLERWDWHVQMVLMNMQL